MPGMPIVEKHAPGDFCWMELATTDHAGAKKFYSELFAWSFTESPIGPNEFYTMFKVDGRDVGAACRLDAEQQGTTTTISSTTMNSLAAFFRPRFAIRRHRPTGRFICRCPIAIRAPLKPKILARNSLCRPCRLKVSDAWPRWRIRKAPRSRSSKPSAVPPKRQTGKALSR